jgi:hypothetical protein
VALRRTKPFFATDRIESFLEQSRKGIPTGLYSRANRSWVVLDSHERCAKIAINFDITIKD